MLEEMVPKSLIHTWTSFLDKNLHLRLEVFAQVYLDLKMATDILLLIPLKIGFYILSPFNLDQS